MSTSAAPRRRTDLTGGPSEPPAYLRPLAAVDGAGSALLGVLLLVAPGWLATGLGLATDRAVQVTGALFVLNGIVNGWSARRRTWASTAPCVTIDLVFAGVMLGIIVVEPWTSEPWARGGVAGLGALSFALGIVKLRATRRLPS